MKTFSIPAQTRLKITKATPRKETHGKELVQAISLKFEWWPQDNAAVNLLHDGLQDALWWTPPEAAAQDQLEGIPSVKKHRRVPTMAMPVKVEASFSGYTLNIDHGIDDSTALELYTCALDKFEVEAKEGGSAGDLFAAEHGRDPEDADEDDAQDLEDRLDDALAQADDDLEAGLRDSIDQAGLKPKRQRRAAGVH